ncbi:hypothetical protein F5Y02DRAFT_405614 [Annulohypoxylon stygium]|nr:hypothetical protein F5Y02DRAFT_405614 [Annulohypoxylon stygium]
MKPVSGESSGSDSDRYGEASDITLAVLARKAKQASKKSQPWKAAYVPKTEDKPTTTSPHDKPWIREHGEGDQPGNWGDEAYDTDNGKT